MELDHRHETIIKRDRPEKSGMPAVKKATQGGLTKKEIQKSPSEKRAWTYAQIVHVNLRCG